MRRSKTITIDTEGSRDKGKTYILTEMPPTRSEKWACRMLLAMGRSGLDVDESMARQGWAGLLGFGIRAFGSLKFEDAEPLMDEMMECVQIQTNVSPPVVRKLMTDDDIEEIGTLFMLRKAVFELHTGFSIDGVISALNTASARMMEGGTPTM